MNSEKWVFFWLDDLQFLLYLTIQKSRMYWKEWIIFLALLESERFILCFYKFPHLSFLETPSNLMRLSKMFPSRSSPTHPENIVHFIWPKSNYCLALHICKYICESFKLVCNNCPCRLINLMLRLIIRLIRLIRLIGGHWRSTQINLRPV